MTTLHVTRTRTCIYIIVWLNRGVFGHLSRQFGVLAPVSMYDSRGDAGGSGLKQGGHPCYDAFAITLHIQGREMCVVEWLYI